MKFRDGCNFRIGCLMKQAQWPWGFLPFLNITWLCFPVELTSQARQLTTIPEWHNSQFSSPREGKLLSPSRRVSILGKFLIGLAVNKCLSSTALGNTKHGSLLLVHTHTILQKGRQNSDIDRPNTAIWDGKGAHMQ